MRGGHSGTSAVLGRYFFFVVVGLSVCLAIPSGGVSIIDRSRDTAQGARWAGDEVPIRGDGTSRSRGSSVAHCVFLEIDGSGADCLFLCLQTLLLYSLLLLGAFLISSALSLFKLNHQKWSVDIFPWFP